VTDRDFWDEEDAMIADLIREVPLRVHRRHGSWVCLCRKYDETGKCSHLVPFLRKEDVDVKEEYL
jgi:hypothetical protein